MVACIPFPEYHHWFMCRVFSTALSNVIKLHLDFSTWGRTHSLTLPFVSYIFSKYKSPFLGPDAYLHLRSRSSSSCVITSPPILLVFFNTGPLTLPYVYLLDWSLIQVNLEHLWFYQCKFHIANIPSLRKSEWLVDLNHTLIVTLLCLG